MIIFRLSAFFVSIFVYISFIVCLFREVFWYMMCAIYNVVQDVDRPILCSLADKGCVWKLRHWSRSMGGNSIMRYLGHCAILYIWFCFPITLMLHCCINVTTPMIHIWLVVKPRFNFSWWQLISTPYTTSNMLASGGQILHSHRRSRRSSSTVGDPADPRF